MRPTNEQPRLLRYDFPNQTTKATDSMRNATWSGVWLQITGPCLRQTVTLYHGDAAVGPRCERLHRSIAAPPQPIKRSASVGSESNRSFGQTRHGVDQSSVGNDATHSRASPRVREQSPTDRPTTAKSPESLVRA